MGRLEQQQGLRTTLGPKVALRQALIADRDRLIAEIAECSDEIAQAMALADEKTIRVDKFIVTLVENPGRMTLDKHRLVELGVSPNLITEATTRGAPSISLQVRTASEG
jgi:hypothetical protein